MRFILLLLSFTCIAIAIRAQETECLQANLYTIATTNATDSGVVHLEFLREILKDRTIVALGEVEHGAGSDFESKTRLVKFLHEEMGFNVIAFESGMYDCEKAWQLIKSGENADTVVGKGIYGVWSESRQMQPLFHYVEQEKNKPQPLVMTGFDLQFSGSFTKGSTAGEYLATDFTVMIKKYEPMLLNQNWWAKFINDLDSITEYKCADSMMLVRYLDTIKAKLGKLPSNEELAFWMQWMKSTQHYLTDQINRDRYMAENFVWLRNNLFPNEKIILWGASLHFMYSFESFKKATDRRYIEKEYKVPMGYYLKKQYGDKLYTIGSTFYEGNMAWAWEKDGRTFPLAAKNMIEYALNNTCKGEHCFLDFSKMSADCLWKSKPIKTRAFGITERLLIPLAFDGLVFHKKMERSYLAD